MLCAVLVDRGLASSKGAVVVHVDEPASAHERVEAHERVHGARVQVAIEAEVGEGLQTGRRQRLVEPAFHDVHPAHAHAGPRSGP